MEKIKNFLYCLGSYTLGVVFNIIAINHEVNRKTLLMHIICFMSVYITLSLEPILYKFIKEDKEK